MCIRDSTIALQKGGYLETVNDGVNGVFFDNDQPAEIVKAIKRFERGGIQRSPVQLRDGMMAHSSDQFRDRYAAMVNETVRTKGVTEPQRTMTGPDVYKRQISHS